MPARSILDAIELREYCNIARELSQNQCLSNLTELTYEGYYPNDNNEGLSLASEMKRVKNSGLKCKEWRSQAKAQHSDRCSRLHLLHANQTAPVSEPPDLRGSNIEREELQLLRQNLPRRQSMPL